MENRERKGSDRLFFCSIVHFLFLHFGKEETRRLISFQLDGRHENLA